MPTATLTTKGQVTIPKAVREHLQIDTGDQINFMIQDDGSVVVRPVTRPVSDLAGLLHRSRRRAVSLDDMDAGISARMRERFGRR